MISQLAVHNFDSGRVSSLIKFEGLIANALHCVVICLTCFCYYFLCFVEIYSTKMLKTFSQNAFEKLTENAFKENVSLKYPHLVINIWHWHYMLGMICRRPKQTTI